MIKGIDLSCERGGRKLFRGLSFELNSGELLHFKGDNGTGKTTLLRSLCLLNHFTEGKIAWNNQDVMEDPLSYLQEIIYIGHKLPLKLSLTPQENLFWYSQLNRVSLGAKKYEKIDEALSRFSLTGFEDLPTFQLSAGQKKRVILSRLLLEESKVWVLDEPFASLDRYGVEILENVIQEHLNKGGMVILTNHQDKCLENSAYQMINLQSKG